MGMKDWTGNKATTFATLGASNHSETERAENIFRCLRQRWHKIAR